jgi:hypothetical protein
MLHQKQVVLHTAMKSLHWRPPERPPNCRSRNLRGQDDEAFRCVGFEGHMCRLRREVPLTARSLCYFRRNIDEGAQVTILASDGLILMSYSGMMEFCGLDDAASTG